MQYTDMNKDGLKEAYYSLKAQYDKYVSQGLSLDLSRGKPSAAQLDITIDLLTAVANKEDCKANDGVDCRNYGLIDGINDAKEIFAELFDIDKDNIILGGNSSLNLMYDTVLRAMQFGMVNSEKPWSKYDKVKFLCPVPGYDRHFAICECMGIEMINVPMTENGPDMDMVEELVSSDETIKGIWCVPVYSNPDGYVYSDETVIRFANLKPAASDFTIFWDNAYVVHHLTDKENTIPNIITECEKAGNPDMVIQFASTSKISFPGSGISMISASKNSINFIKKQMFYQTIGPDKLNQMRHVKFFGNAQGVKDYMKKHRDILKPKFDIVIETLDRELAPCGIAQYTRPEGGYFISVNLSSGCAKRTVELAKNAGLTLTPAGATFPYGKDPEDSNIRFAPSFPPVNELAIASEIFCICAKLATIEKLLSL